MKKILLIPLLFFYISVFAQTTSLTGTVINATTRQPIQGVSVQLKKLEQNTLSGFDGSFYFEQLNPGEETLIISSPEIATSEITVNISANEVNDIGMVLVSNDIRRMLSDISLMLIDEESFDEDADQGDYNILSLMTASNDVFIASTTWNFSAVRFKLRGYDYRYSDMFINGVNFNDPSRGGFSYGIIGGLNDATRNRDIVNGLNPSSFTFGQIGGSGNINANAADFSRGGRIGATGSNTNYKLRGTATYSTGLMENGWAVTGSLAYRWADEGFIEGTFYNSLGYLLAIEKEFNPKHRLSFTTLGAPTQRGQQSTILQEVADLTENNLHNVYWGWQDGKKRNSRIVTSYEPIAVLSHTFNIDKNTKLTTGVGFKYTMHGSTRLDWFNSLNPAPDYYRFLPSFQTNPSMDSLYTALWQSGDPETTQINWARLYMANELEKQSGSGNALYKVEEHHNNQMLFSFNSTLNTRLSEHISFTAGIDAKTAKGMHYKTISDLLGADYFVDIDQFALRDFKQDENMKQNDLNNPNRKVTVGDRFGYDYNIYVNSADVWLQNTHGYKKWDIYYGFSIGYTEFWREGNMRNGRAPENSYGKGKVHSFINQSTKLGLIYKLTGRHFFSGNASYSILPPLAYNSYVSARIKDNVIPDLTSEKIFAADLGYNFSTPAVRGSFSVFQTNFYDQAKLSSYYSDFDGSFVNYALTGINRMHRGVELGVRANVNSYIALSLAGTVAEYIHTNRPTGTVSFENGSEPDRSETVYLKNFYVGGTPQTAGTFGIHVFYKFWMLDVNINGFDRTYVDISPSRRTEAAIDFFVDNYEDKLNAVKYIINQEKFAGGFTLDCSLGKSIRLNNDYRLNINAQFKNILNNTNLKISGFEQMRFDYSTYDVHRFDNKYTFAQGFNFFLNVGLKF